jgi:hypothetical protein
MSDDWIPIKTPQAPVLKRRPRGPLTPAESREVQAAIYGPFERLTCSFCSGSEEKPRRELLIRGWWPLDMRAQHSEAHRDTRLTGAWACGLCARARGWRRHTRRVRPLKL